MYVTTFELDGMVSNTKNLISIKLVLKNKISKVIIFFKRGDLKLK